MLAENRRSQTTPKSDLRQLVEYMATFLVKEPDSVIVREIQGGNATILQLSVAEDDMGRVIGKGGRVANAMRTLLCVAAARGGRRATLEIVENGFNGSGSTA